MKKISYLLLIILFICTIPSCTPKQSQPQQQEQFHIGVVDLAEITASWEEFKTANRDLEREMRKKILQFKEQSFNMNEAEKEERQKIILEEFKLREEELRSKMLSKLKEATKKTAKEKGVPIVLYQSQVKYGGVNLTNDVLKVLQQQ